MCCQTRRRDDEGLLHRTITYKIGPYVRGTTLDTPATSNYLNLPSKTKMLRNRFIQSQTTQPMKITKAHRSSPREHNYEEKGVQIATSSPTYFINIYIHQESDRQENTFSLTNLWKGGKTNPHLPPLIPSPIQFTNKTDQQGNISSPTNLSTTLFLIRHMKKTLPNTPHFPFIKYDIRDWHTLFLRTMVLCSTTFSIVTLQL